MDLVIRCRFGWWLAVKYPVVSTALMAPDNPIAMRTRLIADKLHGKNTINRPSNGASNGSSAGLSTSAPDDVPLSRYNSSPDLAKDITNPQPAAHARPINAFNMQVSMSRRQGSTLTILPTAIPRPHAHSMDDAHLNHNAIDLDIVSARKEHESEDAPLTRSISFGDSDMPLLK